VSPTVEDAPTVRSAEGVELHMPLAGPTARMLAYAIDASAVWLMLGLGILLLVLMSPVLERWAREALPHVNRETLQHPNATLAAMAIILTLLGYFGELLYFTGFELVTGGRSPGKYLVGLRVVRTDGLRVDGKSIWIRNLLRVADVLPSSYVVGLASMLISPLGQRLGDLAAGTMVIRVDASAAPVEALPIPEGIVALPLSRAQLAKLGETERLLIRRTLRRAQPLLGDRRTAVLHTAATTLAQRLELDPALVDTPETLLFSLLLTLQNSRPRT
jgi:uncharacterized RDD family membrane protein YckC